ncbi:MAG TPA: class II aldolase/adducin family protein [Anaeromyxobacter sp.]|nr:class II aldolase/adducin family protein [Anaeromyxobacter sp.]
MLLEVERKLIAEYGRKMKHEGLVKGTGGNLSIFSRRDGLIAISPSARDYDGITPEDVLVVRLDGTVAEGKLRPSSELRMHSVFYQRRTDIDALVHTHSVNATALSCLRMGLPPIYYLTIAAGRAVRCAAYALATSAELAESAFAAMEGNLATLLANHGVLAGGYSLPFAYHLAEQVEFAAELYLKARAVGTPVELSPGQIDDMIALNAKYGIGRKP